MARLGTRGWRVAAGPRAWKGRAMATHEPITGEYSPITWELWRRRQEKAVPHLPDAVVPGGALTPKRPSESRTSITYGFASDTFLREQYGSPFGKIRIARLLEDLDSLAG